MYKVLMNYAFIDGQNFYKSVQEIEKENPEEIQELLKRDFPLQRFGTPEEVANVVAFICSEKASLVNGVSIPVDGAQSRSLI